MVSTALMTSPLKGQSLITTNAAPAIGSCNVYSTVSGGTSLTIPLPQLGFGIQTAGAIVLLEKDPNDSTLNTLTLTAMPVTHSLMAPHRGSSQMLDSNY